MLLHYDTPTNNSAHYRTERKSRNTSQRNSTVSGYLLDEDRDDFSYSFCGFATSVTYPNTEVGIVYLGLTRIIDLLLSVECR